MLIYFFFIFLSVVSYLSSELRNSERWWLFFSFVNCIFLCFGYMCGSDWRIYEWLYTEIDFNNLFYGYLAEPGYYVYMLLGRILGLEFWTFFILTKIICFCVILSVLKRFGNNYKYLAWALFLPQAGYFMFIDNPMRNLIAATIVLYGLRFLLGTHRIRFVVYCVIAMTFHISAILALFLYFLLPKKISSRVYIISLLIVFSLFSTPYLFETVFMRFANVNPYLLKKAEHYIMGDTVDSMGSVFSLGALLQIIFFFLILRSRKVIEEQKNGSIILNGSLLFIIVYRLGLTLSIFSRLQLYLVIFYVIGICYTLRAFKSNSRPLLTFMLISYSLFVGYKNISNNGWKYVPYTNYIPYFLSGDLMSYSQRCEYNPQNTPYKETIKDSQE